MTSKNSVKNRIISLLLIFSVLISNFIYYGFTVKSTENTGFVIGSTVEIVASEVLLSKNPEYAKQATDIIYDVKKSELPALLVIINYSYDDNDELWYEVDAAPGYTWPSKYGNYRYVCDSAVEIVSAATNFVFDGDGNKIENRLTLGQYDKIKLIGATTFPGDVDYNWQIFVGDEWVNIYDADKPELTLSFAVVASALDDDLQAHIRLAAHIGLIDVVSETVTVNVVPYTDAGENAAFYVDLPFETLDVTEEDDANAALEEPEEETERDDAQKEEDETEKLPDEPNGNTDEALDDAENESEENTNHVTETEAEGEDRSEQVETDDETAPAEKTEPEKETSATAEPEASESTETEETAEPDAETENADEATDNPEREENKKLSDFFDTPEPEEVVQPEPDENASTVTDDENDETENISPLEALIYMFAMTAYADEGEQPTVSKKYNVVINYLFEKDGSVAANPYTAEVGETTELTATVNFPTVLGYEPYVMENGALVRRDSHVFDKATFDADFTLNVYYKPALVDYRVNVWQQNVDNDQYTLYSTEVLQGYTDSVVPKEPLSYEGFAPLEHDQPKIAADGSTQVDIFFDRIYYLMKFKLDAEDAYGVQPIYARYGTETRVKDPTRPGYSFLGWADVTDGDNDVVIDLPQNMPAKNTVWKALWKADATAKVSVVFWGENPNDEGYSYQKSEQINVRPETEITYTDDSTMVCGLETHTHTAACAYTCGKPEHTHTVDNCYNLTCTENGHNHAAEGCKLSCKHTHDTNCYTVALKETTKPTQTLTDKGDGIYTYTTSLFGLITITNYVVQIGNKWYAANNTTTQITCNCSHTHGDGCYTCGKTQGTHTHSVECYTLTCKTEEHTHTDKCYDHSEHKHSDSCYLKFGTAMDSNLWTYEKSDTVTVKADGTSVLNVYYKRKTKTLTFKYNYNRTYNSTETITAKWGSKIDAEYKAIVANAGSTFWSKDSNYSGPYTNYFGVMPQEDATYYYKSDNGREGTMTYYGESLDGKYEEMFHVDNVGGYTVTVEDHYDFEGFEYDHGTSIGSSCSDATFYYKRQTYSLQFDDGVEVVKNESVKYEAPLSGYANYEPDPPSIYEKGSVEFAGWYYNPECTEEANLNTMTMPAGNLILYAKWEKVQHKVTVYLERNSDGSFGEKYTFGGADTDNPFEVLHGEKIKLHIPNDPTKEGYSFVGWFYIDENGKEEMWDFEEMTVTRDIDIYAKWTSSVMVPYEINYVLKDDQSTQVADSKKASALAGTNKSFDAKVGDDLYEAYREGYFPTTKSHTISPTVEGGKVTFNFEYVQKDAEPYTVKYLEKGTDKVLNPEKTVPDNRKSVVTENYELINGYIPDAFQKTLIVTAEGENVIVFYYTKDTEHAGYRITHYLQNAARTGYTVVETREGFGTKGDTISETPKTYAGYKYNPDAEGTKTSGTLELNTLLELKLYYDRVKYPYKVRYLDRATGKELHEPKMVTAEADMKYYGEIVNETAIPITNYTSEKSSVSYTMGVEKDENLADPKVNVIDIYYNENSVDINYKVVGPEGCGTVSPTVSHLGVISGTGATSTATANAGFRFVGWYSDKDCTALVSASTVLVLTKPEGGWKEATYYAKFEYALAPLTVTKTGAENIDENQTFIFGIKGTDAKTQSVDLKVVISGNGSVTVNDLPIGDYEVTGYTDWSWRYTPDGGKKTITLQPQSNVVEFTNKRDEEYWLNGAAYSENAFNVVN